MQYLFASYIVATMVMAYVAPSRPCVVTTDTIIWMSSSHFQPRIWLTILRKKWLMTLRYGTQIEAASWSCQRAFPSLTWWFEGGLSRKSDTLKWSKTVLLVSFPIRSQELLLRRMWPGYGSMITLWILPLWDYWPIGCIQEAGQLQVGCCEVQVH